MNSVLARLYFALYLGTGTCYLFICYASLVGGVWTNQSMPFQLEWSELRPVGLLVILAPDFGPRHAYVLLCLLGQLLGLGVAAKLIYSHLRDLWEDLGTSSSRLLGRSTLELALYVPLLCLALLLASVASPLVLAMAVQLLWGWLQGRKGLVGKFLGRRLRG
jgi:hypothetical protein